MPSQEQKAMQRIKQTEDYCRTYKKFKLEQLEAWAQYNLGIRPKTVGQYVMTLVHLHLATYDPKTREVVWIGTSALQGAAKYDG